jgi:hypothetical protein
MFLHYNYLSKKQKIFAFLGIVAVVLVSIFLYIRLFTVDADTNPGNIIQIAQNNTEADINSDAPSKEQIRQMSFRAAGRLISQKDENYQKNIGLLPDSKFYFLKKTKETVASWFKFSDNKTKYMVNLSQKRLIEFYIMQQKGNNEKSSMALISYINLIKKLEDKNIDAFIKDLAWNMGVLNSLSKFVPKNLDKYSEAFQATTELQKGKIMTEMFKAGI